MATLEDLKKLEGWIRELPPIDPYSDQYKQVWEYTKGFALALNGLGPENFVEVRELVRHKLPEITLDTSHPFHSPNMVEELEKDPIIPLLPPGWLTDVYLYARGGYAPVQYSIVSALSALGAWMGRRAWHNRAGRFVLYPPIPVMLLSTIPGLGKGTALNVVSQILFGAGYQWIAPDRITGSKLISLLAARSRRDPYNPAESFIMAGEMSGFFSDAGSSAKGAVSRLIIDMTELYDMKNTFSSSTQIRDLEVILKPTVSGIFCSNLDWLADNMPKNAFTGGFLPRQIVSLQTPKNLPRIPGDIPAPVGVLQRCIEGLIRSRDIKGEIRLSPDANRRFEWVTRLLTNKANYETDDRVVSYLKRLPINTLKIAMLLTIAQVRDRVEEEDFDRAIRLVRLLERSHSFMYERVGTTQYGYHRQVVFHIVRKATEVRGGIGKVKLKRAVSHLGLRLKDYNEIIQDLLEGGIVTYGNIGEGSMGYFTVRTPRKYAQPETIETVIKGDVERYLGSVKGEYVDDPVGAYGSGVNLEEGELDDPAVSPIPPLSETH